MMNDTTSLTQVQSNIINVFSDVRRVDTSYLIEEVGPSAKQALQVLWTKGLLSYFENSIDGTREWTITDLGKTYLVNNENT
jgi:hypothetical protein